MFRLRANRHEQHAAGSARLKKKKKKTSENNAGVNKPLSSLSIQR